MDKMYSWSFAPSVQQVNGMFPCSPEDFSGILDNELTANVCATINKERASWQRGEITAEEYERRKSELKRKLPVFCFHATFADGHRSNASAVPSGLSILDLDHLDVAPREYYFQHVAGREQQLRICLAHVSPSGEGLRLVFRMMEGESLEMAQQRLAEDIGCLRFDACVKDLARCSFAVPRAYIIYLDEPALFMPPQLNARPLPGQEAADSLLQSATQPAPQHDAACCTGARTTLHEATHQDAQTSTTGPADEDDRTYETEFEGVPYETILHALEEQLGGIPVHGSRNNFIFTMACNLRYICNDDEAWIQQVLPNYGEEQQRWKKTIHSACMRDQNQNMPEILKRAIDIARRRHQAEQTRQQHATASPVPPQLPTQLPRSLKLLTSKVPQHLKPAVAMSVFAPLAVHLHGVRFRYNDNSELEPTFQVILVAKMSSGKSCVNKPIDAIMADIKAADEQARAAEQAWKDECAAASANAQKPDRPEGLCVQWVQTDMTNAALVQKLADAQGRFIYSRMDEIELLNNLRTNSRGDQVSQILRLAWDASEYGQERVGVQSVTATVHMRWNFNASTTPQKCRQFFRRGIMDGTVSRMTFATIHTEDDRMPVYGTYDQRFQELVAPYVHRACQASGLVICPRANKLIDKMLEENRAYATLSDDEAWRELSFRAMVAAFKRGMLLYIIEGNRWSREIEDFVRWSFEYDMWCKMWLFGSEMRRQLEQDNCQPTGGVPNLLNCLPETFCEEDAKIIRAAQGMSPDPANMIRNWRRRGYITYDNARRLYTKTETYLASQQARR